MSFLFVLFWLSIQTSTGLRIGESKDPSQVASQCIASASRKTNVSNVAFVTGGIGAYSTVKFAKALALAETLGRIGGWAGSIYLMTDELPDEDIQERMKKPEVVGAATVTFVVINATRDGVDFGKHNAGGGGGYLKSIMFQQPSIKEDILIWHDADKVFGKTDCVVDMFAKDGQQMQDMFNGSPSILVGNDARGGKCLQGGDRGRRCGDEIHLGVLAAHRHQSALILQAWTDHQQKEPNTLDRYTIYDALFKDEAGASTKMIKLPEAFIDHMWNAGDTQCVNHVTNGRLSHSENMRGMPVLISNLCLQGVSGDLVKKAYGL